jgi:hypothetical protein
LKWRCFYSVPSFSGVAVELDVIFSLVLGVP